MVWLILVGAPGVGAERVMLRYWLVNIEIGAGRLIDHYGLVSPRARDFFWCGRSGWRSALPHCPPRLRGYALPTWSFPLNPLGLI